jgi:hypothetical protein
MGVDPLATCPAEESGGFNREPPTAPSPTDHLPGTVGKVEVMTARIAAGYSPWHPGDAGCGGGRVGLAGPWMRGFTDGGELEGNPRELVDRQGMRHGARPDGEPAPCRAHERVGRAGVGVKCHA